MLKNINPPNVPRPRPIENFCGCLAQKDYEGDCGAKTEQQLKFVALNLRRKNLIHNLWSLLKGVKAKVRLIGDNDVYALFL